jgi:adenine C2-methylase RlmN of 23S rRNA A2503 and tRNA A37
MEYKIFESSDTNVKKFVFEWGASAVTKKGIAEAVLYRYGEYAKRTVICCSVQSGCPVGCTFCGTGKFFVRNLDWHEIVEHIYVGRDQTGHTIILLEHPAFVPGTLMTYSYMDDVKLFKGTVTLSND